MSHHMFEHTVSVTVYLTYAALLSGLLVCSILSPIRTVTVDGHQLRLYGVAVVFDAPPPGWDSVASAASGSHSSSSSGSGGGGTQGTGDELVSITRTIIDSQTYSGEQSAALDKPLFEKKESADALYPEVTLSNLFWSKPESLIFSPAFSSVVDVEAARAEGADGDAASRPLSSPSSTALRAAQGTSEAGSIRAVATVTVPEWLYVHGLPSSNLSRCMTAYVVFALLSLFCALALIAVLFVLLLPTSLEWYLRIALRVFTVAGPLCAILCFALAAALGIHGRLLEPVAGGYYTQSETHAVKSGLHSGFSTTVAAATLALLVLVLSPVFWKR